MAFGGDNTNTFIKWTQVFLASVYMSVVSRTVRQDKKMPLFTVRRSRDKSS